MDDCVDANGRIRSYFFLGQLGSHSFLYLMKGSRFD